MLLCSRAGCTASCALERIEFSQNHGILGPNRRSCVDMAACAYIVCGTAAWPFKDIANANPKR
jgi:hypothetical protein